MALTLVVDHLEFLSSIFFLLLFTLLIYTLSSFVLNDYLLITHLRITHSTGHYKMLYTKYIDSTKNENNSYNL